jgi:hypothetical protein
VDLLSDVEEDAAGTDDAKAAAEPPDRRQPAEAQLESQPVARGAAEAAARSASSVAPGGNAVALAAGLSRRHRGGCGCDDCAEPTRANVRAKAAAAAAARRRVVFSNAEAGAPGELESKRAASAGSGAKRKATERPQEGADAEPASAATGAGHKRQVLVNLSDDDNLPAHTQDAPPALARGESSSQQQAARCGHVVGRGGDANLRTGSGSKPQRHAATAQENGVVAGQVVQPAPQAVADVIDLC